MRNCTCPNCNATLTIDDNNREYTFCQYCGTKILLDDYRSTHRVEDVAKIKEVELEKEIRMRELDIEERENEQSRHWTLVAYAVAAVCCIIGAIICLFNTIAGIFGFLIGFYVALFAYIKSDNNSKTLNSL